LRNQPSTGQLAHGDAAEGRGCYPLAPQDRELAHLLGHIPRGVLHGDRVEIDPVGYWLSLAVEELPVQGIAQHWPGIEDLLA
jgi:hypothetical protein